MKIMPFFFERMPKSAIGLTLTFFVPFLIIGLVQLTLLVCWEIKSVTEEQLSGARETARSFSQQIIATRQWNAEHGGVYVEVTETTRPNPYMMKIDGSVDIKTVDGRTYTKINPSDMTRRISEITNEKSGYKFNITGIDPLNPANEPDPWEREALVKFRGKEEDEAFGFFKDGDSRIFRYIVPLTVEAPCLKCHTGEGYVLNETKGGISVTIPMAHLDSLYSKKVTRSLVSYVIVGTVAMLFVFAITWILSKEIRELMEKEMENERLKSAVQLAGAAAHELRQPLTIITGFAELVKQKVSDDPKVLEEADIIIKQCFRMDDIITKMLTITRYKIKRYSDDVEIFDLDVKNDE